MAECMWIVSDGKKIMITPGRSYSDAVNEFYNRVHGVTGVYPNREAIKATFFEGNGEEYSVLNHKIENGYETVTYRRKLEPHEIERRRLLVLD